MTQFDNDNQNGSGSTTGKNPEAPHSHSYLDTGDIPLIQLHRGIVAYNLFQYAFEELSKQGYRTRTLLIEWERWNDCGENAPEFTNALRQMVNSECWKDGPIQVYPTRGNTPEWDFGKQQLVMDLGRFLVDEYWSGADQLMFDGTEFDGDETDSISRLNWLRFPELCMQIRRFLEFSENEELRNSYMDNWDPNHHCPITSSYAFSQHCVWYGVDEEEGPCTWYDNHPDEEAFLDIDNHCPDCWLNKHCKGLIPDEKSINNLKGCGCTLDEDDSIVCLDAFSKNLTKEPEMPLQHLSKDQVLFPAMGVRVRVTGTEEQYHIHKLMNGVRDKGFESGGAE